eukprot:TRINITY_DN2936_c0_g1_i1.p1 TRINITY_DN2936_c0_g1~~TRINITY_DN2936_c0_g1_i1.p1  ORF type:complete len:449 (+),score=77.21 TRINITY_DN2936_c0_g1_i1:37-1347(+)
MSEILDQLIYNRGAAEELQCCICLELLVKPRQCTNGHLFCLGCIKHCLEFNNWCPICRIPISLSSISRSIIAEMSLERIQIRCRFHFMQNEDGDSGEDPVDSKSMLVGEDVEKTGRRGLVVSGSGHANQKSIFVNILRLDPEGCPTITTISSQASHEAICAYKFEQCPFQPRFCKRMRRSEIPSHLDVCPYRPCDCPYCSKRVPKFDLQSHYANDCASFPIECHECTKKVSRSSLPSHISNECPEQYISCIYRSHGCNFQILRKDLGQHERDCADVHVSLIEKSLMSQIERLKIDVDHLVIGREKVINWKISNFNLKTPFYQSRSHEFLQSHWSIGLYPRGDRTRNSEYVSAYLFPDRWGGEFKTVSISFRFIFFNPGEISVHTKTKEYKTKFLLGSSLKQGWGDEKAIRSDEICKLLKDSSLVVRAEIRVNSFTR